MIPIVKERNFVNFGYVNALWTNMHNQKRMKFNSGSKGNLPGLIKRVFYIALISCVTLSGSTYGFTVKNKEISKSDSSALLVYKSSSGLKKTVKSEGDWKYKRQEILENMQKVMGPLPARSNLPPFNVKIINSIKEDNHTRYEISFTVAKNEELTALLYVPDQKGKPKKLPAMLVLHGTDPLGKYAVSGKNLKPNRAYAIEMAQRGYVVIAPDYPSFGGSENYNFENDRYQSGTMKGIFNHMRCVDLLQSRKDVDPERIGVIGHSLGGHNAMFVGAFDTRLKVIVASCGWTMFENYNIGPEGTKKYGGVLGPWAQTRYMPLMRDKYNLDPEKVPFNFDEIIAVLAPRPFFSNSPLSDANFDVNGVKKGIANVKPVYSFLNASANLQVRYPQAAHDFPMKERLEAYQFIDKILKHTPDNHQMHH